MDDVRVAVVIASCGRPVELGQALDRIALQTLAPSAVVLSVTGPKDLPDPALLGGARVIEGSKGSSAQRNRGLDLVIGSCDLVVFIDDDYVPSLGMLRGVADAFSQFPDIVGANGRLLADGINSSGIAYEDALDRLRLHEVNPPRKPRIINDVDGLYGCNMAFRADAIGDVRFDEQLPLYGWQEDIDFAAQVRPKGRLVTTDAFVGIHRGVKLGRTPGVKFGYSQVVNPLYLAQKGTMGRRYARKLILNNLLANHARLFRPEPWVDRWGRVRGNWRAIVDVALNRAHPTKINGL